MSNPEYSNNPEINFEQQAQEIIEHWKSEGQNKVYYDTTSGKMYLGESNIRINLDIDDPKVKEYLAKSLSRGNKYEINKE